jgi:hypothetical protein
MSKDLNPTKALIFRITHRRNVRWILQHGLHCASSNMADPDFVAIGNAELIQKRTTRELPAPHGGTLSDYVPFYFTPFSPMMYNIKTGWAGVTKRDNEDIVIMASSIWRLQASKVSFAFTDRHAYLRTARYFGDPARLDQIDWPILQNRDFKRDPNDPGKFERYEAEALAKGHVPVEALLGFACFNEAAKAKVEKDMNATGKAVQTIVKPKWYF